MIWHPIATENARLPYSRAYGEPRMKKEKSAARSRRGDKSSKRGKAEGRKRRSEGRERRASGAGRRRGAPKTGGGEGTVSRARGGLGGSMSASHATRVLVIVAALALAYSFSLGNDFVYDDRYVILENEVVTNLDNLSKAFGVQFYTGLNYYRPLPLVSFALEYRFWGADPLGYHLTNLVLLIGVSLALYFLLARLLGRGRGWPACLIALCACLHPAVSSVGMALGARGDLLCILFLLGAYLGYAHGSKGGYAAAISLFALALLSKETAVTFPIVLLLMDLLRVTSSATGKDGSKEDSSGRGKTAAGESAAGPAERRLRLLRHAPFWALLVGYVALRSFALPELASEFTLDPATTLKSYLYLVQTALTPSLPLAYEPFFKDWFSWPRLGLTLALIVIAAVIWTTTKLTVRRPIAFWVVWGAITFLPTANIFGQETIYDERYTVLPIVGIVAGIGLLIYYAGGRADAYRRLKLGFCLALLAAFLAITMERGKAWSDDVTFFTQWQSASPANPRPSHHLGIVFWDKGNPDLAHNLFAKAVELDPEYVPSLNMLGLSLYTKGQIDEAIDYYSRAVRLDPNYGAAQFNLATAYYAKGEAAKALPHYQAASVLDPEWLEALYGTARCSHQLKRYEDAVIYYRRVLELDPTVADAYFGLSGVYEEMGLPSQAVGLMRQGLRFAPQDTVALRRLEELLEESP